jgi:hypothetical protein
MTSHTNANGSVVLDREFTDYFPNAWTHEDKDFEQCTACGRKMGAKSWGVVVSDGGSSIVHPDSTLLEMQTAGYMGWWPIGTECAKVIPRDFLVNPMGGTR